MIEGISKIKEENVPAKEVHSYKKTDKARYNDPILSEDKKEAGERDIELIEAVEQIENAASFFNRKLKLEVDKDLGIVVVKVIDSDTEEVIRQIPPEELLELSKHAKDLKGLLISKEV